jgi:hypothetical protein
MRVLAGAEAPIHQDANAALHAASVVEQTQRLKHIEPLLSGAAEAAPFQSYARSKLSRALRELSPLHWCARV